MNQEDLILKQCPICSNTVHNYCSIERNLYSFIKGSNFAQIDLQYRNKPYSFFRIDFREHGKIDTIWYYTSARGGPINDFRMQELPFKLILDSQNIEHFFSKVDKFLVLT